MPGPSDKASLDGCCTSLWSSCRENGNSIVEEVWVFVRVHTKQQRNLFEKKKKTAPQSKSPVPQAAVSTYSYKAVTKYFLDRMEDKLPEFTCVCLERSIGGYQKTHSVVSSLFPPSLII